MSDTCEDASVRLDAYMANIPMVVQPVSTPDPQSPRVS
jgi:hypothetical protein